MNTELYRALGIRENQELPALLEELEQKQFEYLERRDAVSDEERRQELEELLLLISQEIDTVKEGLTAANHSIVFDNEAGAKGEKLAKVKELYTKAKEKKKEKDEIVRKEQEAKRLQKEQEEEIAGKIEEMKKKEEEQQRQKLEQELRALERAEEKDTQKQSEADTSQSDGTGAPGTQDAFSKGLVLYKKQDFTGAFAVFKELAEKEDASAQYMISNMYRRGEGTFKNEERADFWMKKAADLGDATAQMDYALTRLSDGDSDEEKVEEGMLYLGMAADQDYVQAMTKYIEAVKKRSSTKKEVANAIRYCDRLIALANDSFDAQKHEAEKQELRSIKSDAGKARRRGNLASCYTVLGSCITVVAFLYILQGIHGALISFDSGAMIQLPPVSSALLLPVEALLDLLTEEMSFDGIFGLELLLVGRMLLSAGKKPRKKRYAEVVAVTHRCCVAGIFVWLGVQQIHIYGEVFAEETMVAMAAVAVTLVAGVILGVLFSALTGTRRA